MDDKMFNLLETMYSDLINRIGSMDKKIEGLKESSVTKHDFVRLENKMDQNHNSLYDGYKLTYEKLEVVGKRLNEIDKNIEGQDLEIRVIKNVK